MRQLFCIPVILMFILYPPTLLHPVDTVPQLQVSARNIVKKMDELYRSRTSTATLEMEIITPRWQRTLKLNFWSSGMEKTFIRILEPNKERGIATLRVGNEMWNFLPKTNKVIKIPPSMMMGAWMGSDFTNDDLVKEYTFIDDYTFALVESTGGEEDLLFVKCSPNEGVPVVWGHILLAVRKGDFIPVWQKFYDEKGEIMREMLFKDIREFDGKKIPAVMELIPVNKPGKKTIIRYLEARFDLAIDADIFSLRNLRSRF